jgi:hypothetical protein
MTKRRVTLDIETFVNYFLVKIKGVATGRLASFEMWPGVKFDLAGLQRVLRDYNIVTFNGNNFDVPLLTLAMTGATAAELKAAADAIISESIPGWAFYDRWGLQRPDWIDHIDLIEVAPGDGSLKLYGGRLHSKRLQDLPIEHDATVTEGSRRDVDSYCENDLDTTIDLLNYLSPQIDLREKMSAVYGTDLRSKSDAQIAEAVIRKMVSEKLGMKVSKPAIPAGTAYRYTPPAWLRFETPALVAKLAEICAARFVIDINGSPIEPPCLSGAVIRIGSSDYRMGIGGLHSSEEKTAHFARNGIVLMDADVTSYYPSIILGCNLFPKHLTEVFLTVYRDIFDTRVKAKREGNKVVNEVLKIVLNGSFGKFGSKYSVLYAPDLMLQVTLTGQLALLMLIERMEATGIAVVSANTDGIVLKFHESLMPVATTNIKWWEKTTGFGMEDTRYRALCSRDVNNYVAVKDKGVKGKGAYAETSIAKNPRNTICVEAAKAFLEHGTPVAQTVIDCRDIRKFVTVQRVTGGAVRITKTTFDDRLTPGKMRDVLLAAGWTQSVPGPLSKARFVQSEIDLGMDVETAYRTHCGDDEFDYLGKVVRFYYGQGVTGALHYAKRTKTGGRNKVPRSDGAVPCMELPDEFPEDIDYGAYISEATDILKDIGVL